MDFFAVTAFCILSAVVCIILRRDRPEYAAFVSIACGALVVIYLAVAAASAVRDTSALFQDTLISSDMLAVVLRCLGVCVLSELAAESCRDAGEASIATKIELAAKVAMVVISMPLFLRVLSVAAELLRL